MGVTTPGGNRIRHSSSGGTNGRVLISIDRKRSIPDIRVIVNWSPEIAAKLK